MSSATGWCTDKCEVKVMTSGQCWGTHGTTTPGRRFGVVSALPPRRERNTVIQQNGLIIFFIIIIIPCAWTLRFYPCATSAGLWRRRRRRRKTRTQVRVTFLQATTHHQHVVHENQRGHKCQANVRSQQSVQVPVCEREGTYMCRLHVCSRA